MPPRFIVSQPRCDHGCLRANDACGYRVAWSINPHMRVGAGDPHRAGEEHAAFVRTLERAGAIVRAVPFVHGAFDSVFSKDNAVIVERANGSVEAMLAHPRFDERKQEQAERAAAFRTLGVEPTVSADVPLEGGDIVMLPRATGAFLGHGFRTSPTAAAALEAFLRRPVTSLELRDDRLYHLDMVLSVLDDGTALVCTEALTPASQRALFAHPAIRAIVRVPIEEALAFGVNLVQVGRTIVWGANAPRTTEALRRLRYDIERVALDQFHLAGGSAACLVSRVHTARITTPVVLRPEAAASALDRGPDSRRAA